MRIKCAIKIQINARYAEPVPLASQNLPFCIAISKHTIGDDFVSQAQLSH